MLYPLIANTCSLTEVVTRTPSFVCALKRHLMCHMWHFLHIALIFILLFCFSPQFCRTSVCTDPLQNVSAEAFLCPLSVQGILFCTSECLKAPPDLLKIYLHESNRVYRDKLVEEKDFQLFDKLQADTVKKFYEVRILKLKQTKVQRWQEIIIWLPAVSGPRH